MGPCEMDSDDCGQQLLQQVATPGQQEGLPGCEQGQQEQGAGAVQGDRVEWMSNSQLEALSMARYSGIQDRLRECLDRHPGGCPSDQHPRYAQALEKLRQHVAGCSACSEGIRRRLALLRSSRFPVLLTAARTAGELEAVLHGPLTRGVREEGRALVVHFTHPEAAGSVVDSARHLLAVAPQIYPMRGAVEQVGPPGRPHPPSPDARPLVLLRLATLPRPPSPPTAAGLWA